MADKRATDGAETTRVEGQETREPEAAGAGGGPGAPDGGGHGSEGAGSAAAADLTAEGEEAIAADAALEHLQAELQALNDRHLRLAAEFDNYRKRVERERSESWARAQAEVIQRLLEVLDDLQRVAHYEPGSATVESLLEGVELVEKKLRHTLESMGLEPVQAEGEFFNPSTMEALMTAPAEHPEEDEVVSEVFQRGYRFKDMLIRPARVRVKKYEE